MNLTKENILEHVVVADNSCWIWIHCTNREGYGYGDFGSYHGSAHRFIYQVFNGPIANELVVDHLCRVTSCVNPAHLRAVTRRENTLAKGSRALAALQAMRTHCPKGHKYDEANTYRLGNHRFCRQCNKAFLQLNKDKYNANRRLKERLLREKVVSVHS